MRLACLTNVKEANVAEQRGGVETEGGEGGGKGDTSCTAVSLALL